ncbi:hypothetical protein EDD17DRAFT_564957 [Pisolithus thermaeus]|nr:hypothetical protein EDD17DRAFT_564957 [Pisolithus thermaeus]
MQVSGETTTPCSARPRGPGLPPTPSASASRTRKLPLHLDDDNAPTTKIMKVLGHGGLSDPDYCLFFFRGHRVSLSACPVHCCHLHCARYLSFKTLFFSLSCLWTSWTSDHLYSSLARACPSFTYPCVWTSSVYSCVIWTVVYFITYLLSTPKRVP